MAAAAVVVLAGADASREEQLWRHRNLGKAYFETPTTVAQAVDELRQALALAPDSFHDRLNYGLALLRSGNAKEGIAELEKAQKQNPSLPHTWFNLGIAFKREGRYADAIRQFQGMLRLVPDEPVSHYNLGLVYNLTGREQEALKEFETAARLDPQMVAPRFQIYNAYRLMGKDEEAARALAVFQEAKQKQKEADESEDVDWCVYAELYDPMEARPAAPDHTPPAAVRFENRKLAGVVDAKSAGLLALDGPNLLAWSQAGLRLYRNGITAVENSGLDGVKGVISVAAGDFDNDGFADLCVLTAGGPLLFRNVKGRFEKTEAGLPKGRYEAAVWLDFDHDYDLDLFLLGRKSVLLRNEGARGFHPHMFPFVAGRAVAATAFRVIPDGKGIDLAVSYADRGGVLYRDRLRGEFGAVPLPLPRGASALAAVDLDNDSYLDLAFNHGLLRNRGGKLVSAPVPGAAAFADLENRGLLDLVSREGVFRNQGAAHLASAARPPGFIAGTAWAAADFDRDGRMDLAAVAPDGSVHALLNRTETKNHWLRVSLEGVKNLKLGAGTEVEVKAGAHYQKQVYEGVPLLFGLGPYSEADTVRLSWPNGLIQNMPKEAALRAAVYKEAPRLSGSCPMVFAWNGREFEFVTDVLGVAPLGASSGNGGYFPVDHTEYVQLPALAPLNGRYEIRITEELHEVSYLDQVRLIAVDHPASAGEIFTNEKFKSPPFPEFRLWGVRHRIYPSAARDGAGRDVLPALLRRDRVYAGGFGHNAAGVARTHALELDFPGAAPDNRAILVLNGWVDWADGSTFLGAAQESRNGLVLPYLQVKDDAGEWRTVIEDMGIPAGKPKTIVVNLAGKFLSASRAVRIVTNLCVWWDQAFLSEDTAPPEARLTPVDAGTAGLRLRGFSRAVIQANREQPERFEYAHWTPASMWNPTPGLYTRYGEVGELVRAVDDRFVIMGAGDELRLRFDARNLPALPAGWKRDFLLKVDGWAKDADANTAFSQTVEPLPFHGMSGYPYPPAEHFPDDAAHRAWRARYNTRPAARFIGSLVSR